MERPFLLASCLLVFYSFRLTPMSHTIHLGEKESQVQFQVENDGNEATPVLITLTERYQELDGEEKRPETKELEAFPPQLIIPPNEKRTVRIKWKGVKPESEKAYRIIAEQLPLNIQDIGNEKKTGSGIKMLLKYEGTLYVNPGKTSPKVVFKKIEKRNDKIIMTFHNEGTSHQIFREPSMILKNKKGEIHKISKEAFKNFEGQNILAGAMREVQVSQDIFPKNFDLNELEATITFE